MQYDKLPYVGDICSTGFELRTASADAISAVEIAAGYGDSGKVSAAALRDFFIACANACHAVTGESETVKLAA